jgi:hypothetical protein
MLRAMQARLLLAIALVAIGACSYFQDPGQQEATIVRPGNFRKGSGVITSVAVLPNANKAKAEAAGASRRKPDPNLYHVELQMDGDGFQAVDIDNGTFMAGEAVELTNDGRLVRVSGTSVNRAVR